MFFELEKIQREDAKAPGNSKMSFCSLCGSPGDLLALFSDIQIHRGERKGRGDAGQKHD
jgi:hypothetical protein